MRCLRLTGLLVFYVIAVAWLSWPLAANLSGQLPCYTVLTCRFDPIYTAWALAEETRALVTSPTHLFEGNIYHPTPAALLYGPTALGALPLFAPVYALTRNALLASNILFLGGITTTAVALHAVAESWTGSPIAGVVSAGVFLATAWIWDWIPSSPHYAVLVWLPLAAFLAVERASPRQAVLLIAVIALQGLVEPIYLAPAIWAPLTVVALLRLARRRTRASGIALVGIVIASAVLLTPVYAAYAGIRRANPDLLQQSVWRFVHLFPAGHTVHIDAAGLRGNGTTDASWPLLILVASGAIAFRLALRRPPRLASAWAQMLGWVVVGFLTSTRTIVIGGQEIALPTFIAFERAFPSVSATIRIPARLGVTMLVALALLAGLAVDAIAVAASTRPETARRLRAVLAGCVGALLYVQLHGNVPTFRVWPGPADLAAIEPLRQGAGPVLELPVDEGRVQLSPALHAEAMFRSLLHERPILNGYSSYYPAGFPRRMELARRLPEPAALAALVGETGLASILVHLHALPPEARTRWLHGDTTGLTLRRVDGTHLLFDVQSTGEPTPASGAGARVMP